MKQAFYLLWLANMTEMGPGAWDLADVQAYALFLLN